MSSGDSIVSCLVLLLFKNTKENVPPKEIFYCYFNQINCVERHCCVAGIKKTSCNLKLPQKANDISHEIYCVYCECVRNHASASRIEFNGQ